MPWRLAPLTLSAVLAAALVACSGTPEGDLVDPTTEVVEVGENGQTRLRLAVTSTVPRSLDQTVLDASLLFADSCGDSPGTGRGWQLRGKDRTEADWAREHPAGHRFEWEITCLAQPPYAFWLPADSAIETAEAEVRSRLLGDAEFDWNRHRVQSAYYGTHGSRASMFHTVLGMHLAIRTYNCVEGPVTLHRIALATIPASIQVRGKPTGHIVLGTDITCDAPADDAAPHTP